MKNNFLHKGDIVCNPKMNYVRIYVGASLANWLIDDFKSYSMLKKVLDSVLSAVKHYDAKIVLDSSSEAERPYRDLLENKELFKLGWIEKWKDENKIRDDKFEIWVSDFECKNNNERYGYLFRAVNQYKNNVSYAVDINHLYKRKFLRKFLCPMSRNTIERKKLYELFESDDNLKQNTFYSFNYRENPPYPNPEEDDLLPHLPLERYGLNNNIDVVRRDETAGIEYQYTSIVNILCETFFYKFNTQNEEQVQKFFTEKTFRPLAICQPFIYVGMHGMLDKLKSYGFKTFGDFWDESYDNIEDDDTRLDIIMNIIKKLNEKSLEELHEMYIEMIPILKHNFNRLYNIGKEHYEFHISHNYNQVGNDESYFAEFRKIFENYEKIPTNFR